LNFTRENLSLYLVTDRSWLGERKFTDVIREALEGGVSLVQLREKDLDYDNFLKLGKDLKYLCREYGVPFIVNDNVELAREIDADGVHIGQGDMAYEKAREILGEDKIIGVSCTSLEEALKAKEEGADYIGIGSIFPTSSKEDAEKLSWEVLVEITQGVDIPIVGIGGINKDNILDLKGLRLDGISLISGILAQKDIKKASEELLKLSQEAFYGSSNL